MYIITIIYSNKVYHIDVFFSTKMEKKSTILRGNVQKNSDILK